MKPTEKKKLSQTPAQSAKGERSGSKYSKKSHGMAKKKNGSILTPAQQETIAEKCNKGEMKRIYRRRERETV